MNRSYSKIRHIQKSNERLENRLLNEQSVIGAPNYGITSATNPPAVPIPQAPAPVTPAPVTPAPVTPEPTAAPVTPAPVTPAPVTPAPVTPAPVTPEPTAAPVTPAPVTPSPIYAAPTATPSPTTPSPSYPAPVSAGASQNWDCLSGVCTYMGPGAGTYVSEAECLLYCSTPAPAAAPNGAPINAPAAPVATLPFSGSTLF